jgi:hypothetical protein
MDNVIKAFKLENGQSIQFKGFVVRLEQRIIDLRIINGKFIIFPKAVRRPRYKTRGDAENVGVALQY